jgi:UDP-N-acetylglucosamine/UDP-N-acetylgalactosamine diphosphorylase
MDAVPESLKQRLHEQNQHHVLQWWPTLTAAKRRALVEQLDALDLDLLQRLYAQRDQESEVPSDDRIAPLTATEVDAADRAAGEEALRRGEVAVLVVAGGQGSRLGFDSPKGMFEIGPVRNTPLFQILAEKTLATQRRYGQSFPFLIMTSPATHEETREFFTQHRYFGLAQEETSFFCQGTMPALDLATGKLLMAAKDQLFLSPNGHGGCLLALAQAGLLDALTQRGIRHLFYCQVDNPLVRIADPLFLGHHIRAKAEASTKVIAKDGPLDKLGNLVLIDGRCGIIEYSDLPSRLAHLTDAKGRLLFGLGNSAIHVFDVKFLKRAADGDLRIPFHVARKKVPHIDMQGQPVEPKKENALKFEMFIFDVLPRAQRWTVVDTDRAGEFRPVKNATGSDSPTTVRQAMSNLAGNWLEHAGVKVPRSENGDVAVPLEISPLFALDAEELKGKAGLQTRIAGPTYFG